MESVADASSGISDSAVLELAVRRRRILLTADKDFTELVFRHRARSFGVILLRLGQWTASRKLRRMVGVFEVEVPAADSLMVIEPSRIRRRRFGLD